jgi:hypothetical protein
VKELGKLPEAGGKEANLGELMKAGLPVPPDFIVTTGAYKTHLEVEATVQGERQKMYASQIVLSAGGLGTAQILQASKINKAGEGFFCDPITIVQGLAEGFEAGKEIPMAAGMIFEKEGFVLTDLTLPKLVYQLFSVQALRPNRVWQHGRTMGIAKPGYNTVKNDT